jgi:hypothetical protein
MREAVAFRLTLATMAAPDSWTELLRQQRRRLLEQQVLQRKLLAARGGDKPANLRSDDAGIGQKRDVADTVEAAADPT